VHLFNSTLGYTHGLAGGAHVGRKLLRDRLTQIHKDVVACWNFDGEALNYLRFGVFLLDLRLYR
jgi:hypothetical protein